MDIRVGPEHGTQTHHIELSDLEGRRLGLILCDAAGRPEPLAISRSGLQTSSLKISEGNPKLSDSEPPFTPVAQEDWSGGFGQEAFERNVTKFLHSYRARTTTPGRATLNGLEHYTTGYRSQNMSLPGSVRWQALLTDSSRQFLGHRFVTGGYTAAHLQVLVKRKGTPPGPLTLSLRANSGGNPGAVLTDATLTVEDFPDVIGKLVDLEIEPEVLGAGTFHLVADAEGDSYNHWLVGVNPEEGDTKESADGTAWVSSAIDLYYRVTDVDAPWWGWFYEYKSALYFLANPDAGGAPRLWMNGDRGAADSNAGNLDKVIDATKAWTVDAFVGATVVLIEGPGSLEPQPWRKVVANTATQLVVDTPWIVQHTTSTSYVILGTDTWRELTGHGLAAPVQDLIVVNDIVYYAMGDETNIRRHREYNNSGTWVETDWADDGSNKAAFLAVVDDAVDGRSIWRVLNATVEASVSEVKAWGTALTFGAAKDAGDQWDKATRIVPYVDPRTSEKIAWVLKQGSIFPFKRFDDGSIKGDKLMLDEMRAVKSPLNGRAALAQGNYLYFSLLHSVERFFNDLLEDHGWSEDRGLPVTHRGPVAQFANYPGKFFAAIDAGEDRTSSILSRTGAGWHPEYEAPRPGQRIRACFVQVIPGGQDRLWFCQGQDLLWLSMPSETHDPLQDPDFEYTWECAITSSRIYVGMQDRVKLYDAVKVSADNLGEDCWIEVDFKYDDEDSDWQPIEGLFDVSPSLELPLVGEDDSVVARWVILRTRLLTTERYKTPVLRGLLAETISRSALRFGHGVSVRLRDDDRDLLDRPDGQGNALDKLNLLDEWANSLSVLRMRTAVRAFDRVKVFIDQPNLTPYLAQNDARRIEGLIAAIPITQVSQRRLEEQER